MLTTTVETNQCCLYNFYNDGASRFGQDSWLKIHPDNCEVIKVVKFVAFFFSMVFVNLFGKFYDWSTGTSAKDPVRPNEPSPITPSSPRGTGTPVVNAPIAQAPASSPRVEIATPVVDAPIAQAPSPRVEIVTPVVDAPIAQAPSPRVEIVTPVVDAPIAQAPFREITDLVVFGPQTKDKKPIVPLPRLEELFRSLLSNEDLKTFSQIRSLLNSQVFVRPASRITLAEVVDGKEVLLEQVNVEDGTLALLPTLTSVGGTLVKTAGVAGAGLMSYQGYVAVLAAVEVGPLVATTTLGALAAAVPVVTGVACITAALAAVDEGVTGGQMRNKAFSLGKWVYDLIAPQKRIPEERHLTLIPE